MAAMTRRTFLALPAFALAATPQDELERTLLDNILAFWYPRSIDRPHGGYMVDFDASGAPRPGRPKMIVTQARMLWFFARMARAGYGNRTQMLDAAAHGYAFLTTQMWDARYGGFFWQTDDSRKHLYGNAFGLYALSEYALAGGRKDALDFANRHFDLLEEKSHDSRYGGYRESFLAGWSVPPETNNSAMGVPPRVKLMNTHLHLMEAITTYYRASQRPAALRRLIELIQIQSNAVIRKGLTAGTDQYEPDWTPILKGAGARVSYGHDIENVWLLHDACDAAALPFAPLLDLARELWTYALRYGWDAKEGGFWNSGDFRRPASDRGKAWWVQAEALVSALTMWRLTGEERYRQIFDQEWGFIKRSFIDAGHGEWHENLTPESRPTGAKGHAWKAAYHNGRAMIESIRLLNEVPA